MHLTTLNILKIVASELTLEASSWLLVCVAAPKGIGGPETWRARPRFS